MKEKKDEEELKIEKFWRAKNGMSQNNYKCVFLGDKKVGKTQIISRFYNGSFNKDYVATQKEFSVVSRYKSVSNKGEHIIFFSFWDLGLDINLDSFLEMKDIAFFFVYDVTNKKSFEYINKWLNNTKIKFPKDAKFVLIGNKSDLEEGRQVTQEEGKNFADDNKMEFIEVSAKTGKNLAYTEEEKGMAANNNGLENILKEFAVEFLKNYKKEPQSQNYNYSQGEQSDDKKNDDIPSGDGNQDSPQNNNCCQKCCPGDCCKCEDE